MPFHGIVAAALFGASTVEVPAGSILCKSPEATVALISAVNEQPDNVRWLMAGACERINLDFGEQRVLETEPLTEIEWSNGIFRRQRFLVPDDVADQIPVGRTPIAP